MAKAIGKFMGFLSTVVVSWGLNCLMLWLLSECFNFSISLKQATGIWLAVIFIRMSFGIRSSLSKKEK